MIRFLTTAAGAATFVAVSAQASFISVDFRNDNGVATGPAVVGDVGDVWNTFSGPGFNPDSLNDTSGALTSVGWYMDTTPEGGGGFGSFSYGSEPLLGDYLFMSDNGVSDDATLIDGVTTANYERRMTIFTNGGDGVVEDLDPNQLYNLYIYAAGDSAGQGSQFMLKQDDGGVTYSTLATSGVVSSSFIEGGNYIVFENISPTAYNGGYEFELSWFNGSADFAAINGFQLEVVPEPGSLALLGLGGLMIARRRRS